MSKTLSQQFIQAAIANPLQNEQCPYLHPTQTCTQKMLTQFLSTFKASYKTYLFLYLTNFLIFRLKKFKAQPKKQIYELTRSLGRSMLAICGQFAVLRRMLCFMIWLNGNKSWNLVVSVFVGNFLVLIESEPKRKEIALFCVNKSVETLYNMARRRNYPVRIPRGECLVFGIAISVICYFYVDCPDALKGYMTPVQKIIGDV